MPIARVSQEIASPPSIVTTRRLDSLQAARAIGALLVVLCHTSAFIGEEPGLWQRTSIYLWFRGTALGVQLFFVLSGIVGGSEKWGHFGRIVALLPLAATTSGISPRSEPDDSLLYVLAA
jgi:hypothetical protein